MEYGIIIKYLLIWRWFGMARILAIDDELYMLTLRIILIKGDHIVDIYQTTVDIDENSLGKGLNITWCNDARGYGSAIVKIYVAVDCPIIF